MAELCIDDSSRNTHNTYTDEILDFVCRACPNLLRLKVHESYNYLSDEGFETIVTHCPLLESLSINWESITDSAMDALSSMSTLKELALTCCDSVTSEGIVSVLKANRLLECVSISTYSEVNDNILRCISEHLSCLRELTLDIGTVSRDSMFTAITKSCPLLEKLEIESWVFDDEILLSLSQHCPRLRHLLVGWFHAEADAEEQVEEEEEEEQSMVTEAALIQLFQSCPDLRSLEYLPRSATDASLRAIAVHCRQFEMIGIRCNTQVTDAGLCDMFKACPHLTTVQIHVCPNVSDESILALTRYCPEIRIMTLDCPKLTETSLLYVAAHIRKLQELNVCSMSLSDDLVSVISRRCKRLKSFSRTSCTGVTAVGILSVISRCRRLKRVFVYDFDVHITPELDKYINDGPEGCGASELYVSVPNDL